LFYHRFVKAKKTVKIYVGSMHNFVIFVFVGTAGFKSLLWIF